MGGQCVWHVGPIEICYGANFSHRTPSYYIISTLLRINILIHGILIYGVLRISIFGSMDILIHRVGTHTEWADLELWRLVHQFVLPFHPASERRHGH